MPGDWEATLLAVDGDVTQDVIRQLKQLPKNATHLVISAGGNDALRHADMIENVESPEELTATLSEVLPSFRQDYAEMLDAVMQRKLHTAVCTIYDRCPFPEERRRQFVPLALDAFDDIIQEEAGRHDLDAIELREVCTEPEDFSSLSPIEPSAVGGLKIVHALIEHLHRPSRYD
jgi:hypothetical protein